MYRHTRTPNNRMKCVLPDKPVAYYGSLLYNHR